MACYQHGAVKSHNRCLDSLDRFQVKMIGRFIKDEEAGAVVPPTTRANPALISCPPLNVPMS